MIQRLRNLTLSFTGLALLLPAVASAHVIVTPAQVGIGQAQTFAVSVPNEKQAAVTQIKLTLPAGLDEVSPVVKAGWQVQATKTSITWSNGSIPPGFSDDFTFRAQAPAQATELDWKAYQAYADGTVVSWDQKPTGSDDEGSTHGPYSVTKVIDDLTTTKSSTDNLSLIIAIVALAISIAALQRRQIRKKASK